MVMLASDVNNPQFTGAINPDSVLAVWFFAKPIKNPFRTQKEGRAIFEDVVYIHIEAPGDRDSIIERPKYESDEQRFPLHWAAWLNKHGSDQKEVGTPLSQWPLISQSQAEELKALKFRTVESVAGASDSQLQSIGMIAGMAPHAFRDRAKAFLMVAQNAAAVATQAEELEKERAEKEEMKTEMAKLKEQVERLTEIAVAPERPKKRGWPKGKSRKVQEVSP